MKRLLRVQDKEGRGPWRPGFSAKWVDDNRDFSFPPIFSEVENLHEIAARAHEKGLHIGCAVGTRHFSQWFTDAEIVRLKAFGFRVVNATPCQIIAKTPTQVLVASHLPLSKLTRVAWPELRTAA